MIREMAKRLEFPEEGIAYLGDCFDKMTESEESNDLLAMAMDAFFANKDYSTILQNIAEQTGVHPYGVNMAFLLLCADSVHDIYYIKELPDSLFRETMKELKNRLTECKREHDIWGTDAIKQLREVLTKDIV